jgi:hypothetical protein
VGGIPYVGGLPRVGVIPIMSWAGVLFASPPAPVGCLGLTLCLSDGRQYSAVRISLSDPAAGASPLAPSLRRSYSLRGKEATVREKKREREQ